MSGCSEKLVRVLEYYVHSCFVSCGMKTWPSGGFLFSVVFVFFFSQILDKTPSIRAAHLEELICYNWHEHT